MEYKERFFVIKIDKLRAISSVLDDFLHVRINSEIKQRLENIVCIELGFSSLSDYFRHVAIETIIKVEEEYKILERLTTKEN
jgi:hypothetical protein